MAEANRIPSLFCTRHRHKVDDGKSKYYVIIPSSFCPSHSDTVSNAKAINFHARKCEVNKQRIIEVRRELRRERRSADAMSGSASNFPPVPDPEPSPWDDFFDFVLTSPAALPRAVPYRATSPGQPRTRSFVPERVMSPPTPSSLAGFTTPISPLILLENAYARPRVIVHEPLPRSIGQPNAQVMSEHDSMSTGNEQKEVLSKLKKEIYNPGPKRIFRRLSLYYRENARNGLGGQNRHYDDDDGKRCAICLDDFEPMQEVMVTPCNHMFHEDCIVPWLQGHGQCPVCRFSLYEQKRQTRPPIAPVAIQPWETMFYVPETLFR